MPVVLAIAFFIVRLALVQSDPSRLIDIWPGHPAATLESGLSDVGMNAAAGEPVDPALVRRLLEASAKAPLSPEPFLVRGVQAQVAGDHQLALRAFQAARERNPRNVAARYFLANHYLDKGKVVAGLAEVSVLARLVPQSLPSVAPFLATFARSPGAAPQMKALLRTHPQLESPLLNALAGDAANAGLMLTLWSGRGGEEADLWQSRLLNQLVQSGDYVAAHDAWARFAGRTDGRRPLVDPDFSNQKLAPFGWTLASGPAGVAEAEAAGRLHILFYGRDDLVLASQLLTLAPGRYKLSVRSEGTPTPARMLAWVVKCLPSSNQIALIPIGGTAEVSGTIQVPPANCGAQQLELAAVASEVAQQADVTIGQLKLVRESVR